VVRPLVALVGLVFFAGCGAAEGIKTPRAEACPAGTPEVGVKDVLPAPPPGTELIRTDPKGAKLVRDSLREEIGEGLRSISTRVVAKPDSEYGTGVYVMNINERMDSRDVLLGGKAGADEVGLEPKPITIAGEDGLIAVGPDGVAATGVVGDCSSVTLMGDNEAAVRAVAESLRRAE
jgi:hypothetical protein